jgi:putative heme-binding domain-containing protein
VILEGIEPEMPALWFLDAPALDALAEYVLGLGKLPPETVPGDAGKGAAVFRTQGCGGCHTMSGTGVAFGPDLSDIGARRSATHIEKILIHPEAALPEGFLWLRVRTSAGETVQGIRVAETNFTLHLRDARGILRSFNAGDLAQVERLSDRSPMPAYKTLSASDRTDLVAFLAAQKGNQ